MNDMHKIKNLICKYKTEKNPILHVDNLEIERRYCILFRALVWKSTILKL